MPDFSKASVQSVASEVDLTPYTSFLQGYAPGAAVSVPLEDGEKKRMVMRFFNKAAATIGQKLYTLKGDADTVSFRIVRPTGPRKGRVANAKPTGRSRKTATV